MSNVKILEKNKKLVDNRFVVTQTIEQHLTKEELERELVQITATKKQLIQQNKRLLEQFDGLCEKETEIREMIKLIPDEELQSV